MSNAPTTTAGAVLEFGLGDRLRKARIYAKFEKEELATVLGVTAKTVYNYEQPGWPVKRQTVIAWAFATGVNFDWLWTGHAAGRDDGGSEQAGTGTGCYQDNVIKFPSTIAA